MLELAERAAWLAQEALTDDNWRAIRSELDQTWRPLAPAFGLEGQGLTYPRRKILRKNPRRPRCVWSAPG